MISIVPTVIIAGVGAIFVVVRASIVKVVIGIVSTRIIYFFVFFTAAFIVGTPSCLSDTGTTGLLFFFHIELIL